MLEVTLLALRQRAQYLSNMVGNSAISTEQWNVHINDAIRQYWNLINTTYQDFNMVDPPYSFTTENNKSQYDLPPDFLYLRGLDVDYSNVSDNSSTQRASMRPYMFSERNRWRNQAYYIYSTQWPFFRYRIHNNTQIWFNPLPQSGLLVLLYYIPTNPTLVADEDTVIGVNGFDVYISAIAAKVVLSALSLPQNSIDQMLASWEDMVLMGADTRNRDEPDRVEDVRGKDSLFWS